MSKKRLPIERLNRALAVTSGTHDSAVHAIAHRLFPGIRYFTDSESRVVAVAVALHMCGMKLSSSSATNRKFMNDVRSHKASKATTIRVEHGGALVIGCAEAVGDGGTALALIDILPHIECVNQEFSR